MDNYSPELGDQQLIEIYGFLVHSMFAPLQGLDIQTRLLEQEMERKNDAAVKERLTEIRARTKDLRDIADTINNIAFERREARKKRVRDDH